MLGLRERPWSAFPVGIHRIPTGSCSHIHSVYGAPLRRVLVYSNCGAVDIQDTLRMVRGCISVLQFRRHEVVVVRVFLLDTIQSAE